MIKTFGWSNASVVVIGNSNNPNRNQTSNRTTLIYLSQKKPTTTGCWNTPSNATPSLDDSLAFSPDLLLHPPAFSSKLLSGNPVSQAMSSHLWADRLAKTVTKVWHESDVDPSNINDRLPGHYNNTIRNFPTGYPNRSKGYYFIDSPQKISASIGDMTTNPFSIHRSLFFITRPLMTTGGPIYVAITWTRKKQKKSPVQTNENIHLPLHPMANTSPALFSEVTTHRI